MVSYAEFNRGVTSLIPLAQPVLEQLYSRMDKTGVGLITYEQFLEVLKKEEIEPKRTVDNFNWEELIIGKIKEWITTKRYTFEEAFKCFD